MCSLLLTHPSALTLGAVYTNKARQHFKMKAAFC